MSTGDSSPQSIVRTSAMTHATTSLRGALGVARSGSTSAPIARMFAGQRLVIAFTVGVLGCASDPGHKPEVPPATGVARVITEAASEAGVPAELVLAIAIEEGGIKLPAIREVHADDAVPVAGVLELRHGRLDTLALGAKLLGTTEVALRADTDLATRAGTRVLAELGARHGAGVELTSWRRALEVLSGMDDANASAYASRVFAILRTGGDYPARNAEIVRVTPHLEIAAHEIRETARIVTPAVPDFADAMWFTTSCSNKCTVGRPLGHDSVNKIVIHDTEGGWDGSVATLQYDGGKSVHYIIDADGSRVGQFRPETDTTWHGGNYFYNETSIGIEHVGVAADPAGYSTALYAKSRELVQDIRTRWSVPLDRTHIIGHYQIPDGTKVAQSSPPCTDTLDTCETSPTFGGAQNHRDPGYNWQWCQYMQSLGGSCTCNDAWPMWNCTTDRTQAVRCTNGVVEIQDCTAGCEVMAVGTPDVCNVLPSVGPDAGVDQPPEPPTPDPASEGGCSTGRGAGFAGFSLAALCLLRRRRR